jgi:hypothetical protein
MKLTPEEIDVFKNLSESELGKFLVTYFKRVQDYAFDSRNWEKGMTHEAASHAAKLLQTCVLDKIRSQKNEIQERNQHE